MKAFKIQAAAVILATVLLLTGVSGVAQAETVPAAPTVTAATRTAAVATTAVKVGDVTGDGQIDMRDALKLYGHVSGKTMLTVAQLAAADIDGNTRVDAADAIYLYRIASNDVLYDPKPTFTTTTTTSTTTTTTTSTTVTGSTTTTATRTPGAKIGIDVSYSQGTVDWEKVKESEVDFAILRCGYGQDQLDQDDDEWARNTAECERLGIPYGAYFFCYARNVTEAAGEAQHALRLLKGKQLTYPVYYDLEYSSWQGALSNDTYAAMAKVWCDTLKQAGYKVGVYANLYWWETKLTDTCFDGWYRWIAQYNDICEYEGVYQMWQYTDSGTVDGIGNLVDMNECYVDFAVSEVAADRMAADAALQNRRIRSLQV